MRGTGPPEQAPSVGVGPLCFCSVYAILNVVLHEACPHEETYSSAVEHLIEVVAGSTPATSLPFNPQPHAGDRGTGPVSEVVHTILDTGLFSCPDNHERRRHEDDRVVDALRL